MTLNAIDSVKNYYNSLDEKGKLDFQKETGFNSLYSINLMDPKVAEKFCKSHSIDLGNDSAWNLYYKGKADYAVALNDFNQANKIYHELKDQQDTARAKYTTLKNNFYAQNGEDAQITSAKDNEFRTQSKYTTALIKNTKEADMAVSLALSARFNAVNTQRRGLSGSVFS